MNHCIHRSGFSLLEMSIVIGIIALLIGVNLGVGSHMVDQTQSDNAQDELEIIDEALAAYARRNGRLPCPGALNLSQTDSTFGDAVVDCFDNSPPTGLMRVESPPSSGNYLRIGGVPVNELNLSHEFMADNWNGRYLYTVSEQATLALTPDSYGTIEITNDAGNPLTNQAVYTLLSFGKTGKGATDNETLIVEAGCDVSAKEGENCDNDNQFTDSKLHTDGATSSFYDDILRWRIRMNILQIKAKAVVPIEVAAIEEEEEEGTCPATAIYGKNSGDRFGIGVADAGDVNGDGHSDILIVADYADGYTTQTDSGEAYVIFGNTIGDISEFDVSTLNGTNGFIIKNLTAGELLGGAFGYVGNFDFNGDGIDDIAVGAYYATPSGRTRAGKTYIIYGKSSFGAVVEVSTLNGTNGMVFNGINNTDYSGWSISSAKDVNGDGFGDLLIGAYWGDAGGGNSGESYVVFGNNDGNASFNLSTLNGSNGFMIFSTNNLDGSGYSLSSGDLNNDGYSDVMVGSSEYNANGLSDSGRVFVVFGKPTAFAASIGQNTLNGTNGFTLSGYQSSARAGISVSSGGDINSDGFDDMVIGAFRGSPPSRTQAGHAFLFYGKSTGYSANVQLSTLNGANGTIFNGVAASDWVGFGTDLTQDINNDGYSDLLVGGRAAAGNGFADAGATYVVYGRNTEYGASMDLSSLDGTNGFVIYGENNGSIFSYSNAGLGDVNNDGINDFIIGAGLNDSSGLTDNGSAYIIYGSADAREAFYNIDEMIAECAALEEV